MTQTIEQLTARVLELEEEKKELQALLDFDNARLDQIEDELEDVEYLGSFVEGIKVLKTKLAAAQEEIERLKATPPDKREDLRCVISDLCHQVRERDAQLAKAEQRVAEACALTYLEDYDLTDIADRVRDGEWRKFVKEV